MVVCVYRATLIIYNAMSMQKIDPTVKKETIYIALFVIVLSMAMEAVFLIIGKWDLYVLFGNLLGGGFAVLNFFLMGLTLQSALKKEPEQAAASMKLSQTYRMFMLFIVAGVGLLVPVFNAVATIIPLFFPRIAIALRPLLDRNKKEEKEGEEEDAGEDDGV
ncbi:ATP synthase I chain [Ruminococcaceae bacterium YRB3002]|nr:ATP synthase I chain [Ruminococcaceae bacterium YRB3002]